MFNAKLIVIDAFVKHLQQAYLDTYSNLGPDYPGIIAFTCRMALENIARSEAPYHDMEHTIMVAQVGQEIIRGKHLAEGGVGPRDWVNFIISLLCHDIGYVRGVCNGDRYGHYVINFEGDTITLPRGATDASLTPYHVERGQIFVKERLGNSGIIDADVIMDNIEHTRFPVPANEDSRNTRDLPGLLRAADLIGQMADPDYIRKLSALYTEFKETGAAENMGYHSAADLRDSYPKFYWGMVSPYVEEGIRYLRMTHMGRLWTANLFNHIFSEEHHLPYIAGPERGEENLGEKN